MIELQKKYNKGLESWFGGYELFHGSQARSPAPTRRPCNSTPTDSAPLLAPVDTAQTAYQASPVPAIVDRTPCSANQKKAFLPWVALVRNFATNNTEINN